MIYDYMGNEVAGGDSFDFNDYIYSNVAYDINTGLKVLYLTGDTTGMSKDVKKNMSWSLDDQSGTCTVKWQGQSSAILPKKNYSLHHSKALSMKSQTSSLPQPRRVKQFQKQALRHLPLPLPVLSHHCQAL